MCSVQKYINIEPFHFASEETEKSIPPLIDYYNMDIANKLPVGFAILLDDTKSPGIPVAEELVRKLINAWTLRPCLQVLETYLSPIALVLIQSLPLDNLEIRSDRIFLSKRVAGKYSILIARGFTNNWVGPVNYSRGDLLDWNNIYNIIRPTCSMFIVAWYFFRQMISWDEWCQLAAVGKDGIHEIIAEIAERLQSRRIAIYCDIVTRLHNKFMQSEESAAIIINILKKSFTSIQLASINHLYYD